MKAKLRRVSYDTFMIYFDAINITSYPGGVADDGYLPLAFDAKSLCARYFSQR